MSGKKAGKGQSTVLSVNVSLLGSLLMGGYNVGTIWAHEADIFRSWQMVGDRFHDFQKWCRQQHQA